MPLPVILAALARVAGPVLARVGARAAAGAAAEGAIGSAASQATAARASGFVLDSTKLGNARQITAALGGKPPAAIPAVAPTPPPASAAAPRGWKGGTQSWGTPPTRPTPATPPIQPASPASPAQNPPSSPSRPPNSGQESWGSKLAKKFADVREKTIETIKTATQNKLPSVADETKGMDWNQRYERLQKAGKLLDPAQVGRSIGTPNPTQNQVTEKSEEHEQAAREKFNESVDKAKGSAKAFALSASVGGPIALALAFKKATDAATAYAQSQVEASRSLARFNANIAGAVAKFDLADIRRQGRFSNATSGSTAQLIQTFSRFKDDIQPIKQAVTTLFNTAAVVMIQFARLAIGFMTASPAYLIGKATADAIEANERKKAGAIQGDFRAGINKFLQNHNQKVGK